MRKTVARMSLAVAALGAFWAAWLVFVGGFDLVVGGRAITTNEPLRPLLLSSLALAAYVAAAGARSVHDRWARWLDAIGDGRLAAALAIAVTVIGGAYAVTAAAASDAYGYISEADLWIRRDLHIPQPWVTEAPWPDPQWTFTPLAYLPTETPGGWALVPLCSPGLPMLMAAAKIAGGQELLFWVVPVFGGLLTWATYGIGRRLGSSRAGLIAAWLISTSPIVLFMLAPAMTDIPVTGAWAMAFYFAFGSGRRAAVLSGLAAALAILIRPNLAPLAGAIGLWWIVRAGDPRAIAGTWRTRIAHALMYGIAAAPGVVITAAVYQALYGSPFRSGYGDLGGMFGWQHVLPNARNYFTWFVESQGVLALAGVAALALPLRRVWPWVVDRRAFILMWTVSAFVVVQYLTYLVFDTWWFLRFLLPCWPFVMLGMAAAALWLIRPSRPAVSLAIAWVVLAVGVLGFHEARRLGAFDEWRGERRYVDVARMMARETPERSVTFTMLHSGSLRYYAGRLTLRWDLLHPEWLDRSAAWFQDRGISAYLLIEDWEVADFKKRFAGQALASGIDERLAVVYKGPSTLHVYELTGPPRPTPKIVQGSDPRTLRSERPSPHAFDFVQPFR